MARRGKWNHFVVQQTSSEAPFHSALPVLPQLKTLSFQWPSEPKHLEEANQFGGAKMFDFGRKTVFCLGHSSSKYEMTRYAKNFGVMAPWTQVRP